MSLLSASITLMNTFIPSMNYVCLEKNRNTHDETSAEIY